jgi:hypothetical protein
MTRRVDVAEFEGEANGIIRERESDGWELVDQEVTRREGETPMDEVFILLVFEKGGENDA